jgi:hypothetical protein
VILIGRLRSKVEVEEGADEKWHDLGSDRGKQHAEDLLPSVLEEEAAVDVQKRGRVRSAGTVGATWRPGPEPQAHPDVIRVGLPLNNTSFPG